MGSGSAAGLAGSSGSAGGRGTGWVPVWSWPGAWASSGRGDEAEGAEGAGCSGDGVSGTIEGDIVAGSCGGSAD